MLTRGHTLIVLQVRVRTIFDEKCRRVDRAVLHRVRQRREALLVHKVHIRTLEQQVPDALPMVARRSVVDRGDVTVVHALCGGPLLAEHVDGVEVPVVGRVVHCVDAVLGFEVEVRVVSQKEGDGQVAAVEARQVERGQAVVILDVRVRLVLEQERDTFPVPKACRGVQRGAALVILEVNHFRGPLLLQQELYAHGVAVVARIVERGTTLIIPHVHLRIARQEELHDASVTLEGRLV
mmetsp:Transcript_23461/g.65876  ORF Transcript_23461/g.65876 Transcript_23461/m.65876 type:complete len:237 (-) Transcript_23461:817-1527(-)